MTENPAQIGTRNKKGKKKTWGGGNHNQTNQSEYVFSRGFSPAIPLPGSSISSFETPVVFHPQPCSLGGLSLPACSTHSVTCRPFKVDEFIRLSPSNKGKYKQWEGRHPEGIGTRKSEYTPSFCLELMLRIFFFFSLIPPQSLGKAQDQEGPRLPSRYHKATATEYSSKLLTQGPPDPSRNQQESSQRGLPWSLRNSLPMQRTWVQSLVGEVRSHILQRS